jgi:hypothetical protein
MRSPCPAWLIIAPAIGLSAGTSSQPIQSQNAFTGLTQPGCYFLGLERQFTGTKIAVEQLCNFFTRAWLSDSIQRSVHMFFKAAVGLWDLSKVRLSRLRVSLMGAAHTVRNVKGAPEPQGSQ